MKLKKVLSICKTNGLYYLYDRIDRSGEITQWLGDGYALYPLDGLPILDEESFCAVFDITGKQREKILFRHERLPEHLNVEDVAAGDKLVREYETTFINGGLRLKPLKTKTALHSFGACTFRRWKTLSTWCNSTSGQRRRAVRTSSQRPGS